MKHKPIANTRFFFSTAPLPCPYLDGQVERRLVTELVGRDAKVLHDRLSVAGFRRSHGIIYAPACPACNACKAVRIRVDDFQPSRSQRHILKRNTTLISEIVPAAATDEQYEMFRDYQNTRHFGGDMARMDSLDFRALIEDTPVDTFVVEFRNEATGQLMAACLMDRVRDGFSAVYSFFNPSESLDRRSLGSYMILWLVEHAKSVGLPHVYLGYWINNCSKMDYKAKFKPLEICIDTQWVDFEAYEANGQQDYQGQEAPMSVR